MALIFGLLEVTMLVKQYIVLDISYKFDFMDKSEINY